MLRFSEGAGVLWLMDINQNTVWCLALLVVLLGGTTAGGEGATSGLIGASSGDAGALVGGGSSLGGQEVLYGPAVPKRQVTMSVPLEGVLMHVYVEEGDRVSAGQDLAMMDIRIVVASIDVARLRADDDESVRYAQLELEYAQMQLDRTKQAYEANAAAEQEVSEAALLRDQAQAAFEAAIRVKAIADAALELELQRLEQHKVRAPFSGRVVRVMAQPGATLTTSDPLLTIVSLRELEAEIYLPLSMYGKLEEGASYRLYAEEPVGRAIQARLKMIDPMIEPASRTFRCVFAIDNEKEALPAGFAVRFPLDESADAYSD